MLVVVVFGLVCSCTLLWAQADRYTFPIPTSRGVSGSFGELRGSTYHFGLDIRTFERSGLAVQAAADGYVSRVKVSYSGYGKAIYVQHTSDSNTTVYAHVDSFLAPIQRIIEQRQRNSGVFDQELFFKPTEYPVRAGQVIAWSGNTGASQGPHLHYEVRAANEWPLNPLAYHKLHLRDVLPPVLSRVAFEPLTADSRVEGVWEKRVIAPRRSESAYYHSGVVRISGPVGVEVSAFDRLSGARNQNGLYLIRWLLDDSVRFECRFDRHGWQHLRSMFNYIDARYALRSGIRFQKCYIDEGMDAPFYARQIDQGRLELTDTAQHRLRVELEDFHGNRATFTTRVQRSAPLASASSTGSSARGPATWEQRRGVVVLRGPLAEAAQAAVTVVFADSSRRVLSPAYRTATQVVTLFTLGAGPAPVRFESRSWLAPIELRGAAVVVPNQRKVIRVGAHATATLTEKTLFQAAIVETSERPGTSTRVLSPIYRVGDWTIPVYQAYRLDIDLDEPALAAGYRANQVLLAKVSGRGFDRVGSELRVGNRFSGTVSGFGDFCLVADVSPPQIQANNFRAGQYVNVPFLKFRLTDDIAGVHPFKISLTLDGAWQVPEYYDYQQSLFLRLPKSLARGRHVAKVSVADYAGNSRELSFTFFTR